MSSNSFRNTKQLNSALRNANNNRTTANIALKNANKSIFSALENLPEKLDQPEKFKRNRQGNGRRERRLALANSSTETRKSEPEFTCESQLPLHTKWDFGLMRTARTDKWEPQVLHTITTVTDFWQTANVTFAGDNFSMTSDAYKDFWLFRSGCFPAWEKAKEYGKSKILAEVCFTNITRIAALHAVLYCIGETIPYSSRVLGIRFKPSQKNPRLMLWVSSERSANRIEQFLMEKFSKLPAKNVTSTITFL